MKACEIDGDSPYKMPLPFPTYESETVDERERRVARNRERIAGILAASRKVAEEIKAKKSKRARRETRGERISAARFVYHRGKIMTTSGVLFFSIAIACGAIAGCTPPPPQAVPYDIVMKVESDPGTPISGAAIVRGGKDIIATGIDGRAKLTLAGKEGDGYEFTVRCPEDFSSPSKPVFVYLHRLSDPTKIPEYNALCPPTTRKLVVSIRAEGGPNLPVLYLGKPIARTDASGAAHILLTMKPGDQFELQLDTSEKGNERLRPKMPTGTFAMRQRDDLQSFDQKFFLEKIVYAPQAKKQRATELRHAE